jgi:hypothetical protein
MTMPVYAYRKGPKRPTTKRDDPEFRLQCQVATYLRFALPKDCIFTASMAGAKMGKTTASKAKAAGQARGWPDIMILPPDGVTRYIELKSDIGSLTREQIAFRERCFDAEERTGNLIWKLARSLEDVEFSLKVFGIKPRCGVDLGIRERAKPPAGHLP